MDFMNEITPHPFAVETPAKFSAREFIRMKEIGAFWGADETAGWDQGCDGDLES